MGIIECGTVWHCLCLRLCFYSGVYAYRVGGFVEYVRGKGGDLVDGTCEYATRDEREGTPVQIQC